MYVLQRIASAAIDAHKEQTMELEKLSAFIERHGIEMEADYASSNPNIGDDGWAATHWKCRFRKGKACMTTYFSQGAAHTREPGAEDVLDCLAADAAGIDNARGFEDWCGEYGYDTDSRKAERTYNACLKARNELYQFLGDPEAYDTLLFKTERL